MKPVVRDDQIILVSDDYDAAKKYNIFKQQRLGGRLLLILILLAMPLGSLFWFFKYTPIEKNAHEVSNSQNTQSPEPIYTEKTTTDQAQTRVIEAEKAQAKVIEAEKAQELKAIRDLVKEHTESSNRPESTATQATEKTSKIFPKPIAKMPETQENNTAKSKTQIQAKEPNTHTTVSAAPPHTPTERTIKTATGERDQQNKQVEASKTPPQNYKILEQSLGISLIQE